MISEGKINSKNNSIVLTLLCQVWVYQNIHRMLHLHFKRRYPTHFIDVNRVCVKYTSAPRSLFKNA